MVRSLQDHFYMIRFIHLVIHTWSAKGSHITPCLSAGTYDRYAVPEDQVQLLVTLHLRFLPVPIFPDAAAGKKTRQSVPWENDHPSYQGHIPTCCWKLCS